MRNTILSRATLVAAAVGYCAPLLAQTAELPTTNLWSYHQDFIALPDNLGSEEAEGSPKHQHDRLMRHWRPRLSPSGDFDVAGAAMQQYLIWAAGYDKSNGPFTSNWQPLGPFNTPAGSSSARGTGQIHAIAFHPDYGNGSSTLYAASGYGGLFKSTDAGATWMPKTDSKLPIAGVTDIVIDPVQPDHLFIATGNVDFTIFSAGVYRSVDGGDTWEAMNTGLFDAPQDFVTMQALEMQPGNPDLLLCATSSGIFRSTNATSAAPTWNLVPSTGPNRNYKGLVFDPSDGDHVFVSGTDIWESFDAGLTWSSMTLSHPGLDFSSGIFAINPPDRINIAISQVGPAFKLHALIQTKFGPNANDPSDDWFSVTAVYDQSTDQWELRDRVENWEFNPDYSKASMSSGAWIPIACHPTDASLVAYGSTRVYSSIDEGTTVNVIDQYHDEVHADSHVLAYSPDGVELWIGHDGGISKTTTLYATTLAASTWQTHNSGLAVGTIMAMDGSPTSAIEVLIGNQDEGNNLRHGAIDNPTWTIKQGGDGGAVRFSPDGYYAWTQQYNARSSFRKWENFMASGLAYGYLQAYPQSCVLNNTPCDLCPTFSGICGIYGPDEIPPFGFLPATGKWFIGASDLWFEEDITQLPDDGDDFTRYSHIKVDMGSQSWFNDNCVSEHQRRVVISERNPNIIFYSTSTIPQANCSPYGLRRSAIFKSRVDQNGVIYPEGDPNNPMFEIVDMDPSFDSDPQEITGLALEENYEMLFVTFSGYNPDLKVWMHDGAWLNMDPNNSLPNLPVNDIVIDRGAQHGLYIAMDVGVFYKNESMTDWEPFYQDLPNVQVTDLDINYCTRKLRAATYGRGLWESDLAEGISTERVVSTNENWTLHKNLGENLRVTNGAVLTVTNTVNFAPGTRLTIDPGSKVVVNGGKLLNMCGKSWHGVDVVGNPALSQVPSTNQGRLDLINGALIRNAEVGARAYRTDAAGNYMPGTEGGIIRSVNGSQFIDCGRMVALKPYENVVNGNEISNRSYFSSTTFLVTPERPADLTYNIMVMLEDVSGVQFNNCTFQCEENLDHGVPGPTAIRAFDTRFTVASSDFIHLASGIRASDASGINPCYIRGNTFSETDRGVALMGVNFAEVTGNTFNVTDGPGIWPFTDPLYPTPYGLYLFGCEGFEVEENSFAGVNPEGNVGIATRNIDIGANQFYRNTFDGVLVGSLLQRDNRDDNILNGLQFLCNTYGGSAECEFDVAVTDQGEVAPFQGDFASQQPAGNQFYPECTTADESDIYVENDAPSGFTYIHHVDDFCEPACSTPTFVTLFEVLEFFVNGDDETSSCPSDRSIEHDPVAQAQKFALIKQQYIDLKALYDGEVNAGNTQYLLDLISHSSTSSFDLRTQLLAASPDLSDDVMIAAIEREPAMSDLHISQVLLANDPLTPDVQIALERSDVSAYYQNLVLAQQNGGLSNKSMLEAELSGYRLALEGPRYDAIRLYLERDTVGNPLDSVWHVVGAPDLPGNANSRVAILMAQKDWAAADAMLQDTEPELTPDEVTVWEAVRDVAQNPGNAAQTVTAQSGTLETIAIGNGRAAMMARSLLGQYMGGMFEEPIILPGNRSPRRLNGQEGSSADGMLDAFPNPASDLLRITALSGTPEAAGRLVICDAQGRVVVERPLQPGLQLFELSVQDWSQGTYRVVLWDAQGRAKSTTVAISR